MKKVKFNNDWLEKKDKTGQNISSWCKKDSDTKVKCILCNQSICFKLKGFQSLKQHSESNKHSLNHQEKAKLDGNQTTINIVQSSSIANIGSIDATNHHNKFELICRKDFAYKAELIWTMKTVCCNIPAAIADGITATFAAMFPDGIQKDFSLGRTKLSYLITDALAPYFRTKFLDDLKASYFSLLFDETTNAEGKKELQVAVKYWSDSKKEVVTSHLESFFMGHATAEQLASNLEKAVNNADLSLNNLLAVGCDGPNVNKKVFRILNESVKCAREKSILDIGSCNIHTVHNAFLKGLNAFDTDAVDFLQAIYRFLADWPSRWEDISDIQRKLNLPQQRLIKHVSSRWLTLEPAIKRLFKQWEAYYMYFMKFIPDKQRPLQKNFYYNKIRNGFNNPLMKAELSFICNIAGMFTKFTGRLQRSEPLIHELYDDLKSLALALANRVFCSNVLLDINYDIVKIDDKLHFNDCKDFILVSECQCGDEAKEIISSWPMEEKDKFLGKCMAFYKTSCMHVIQKSSLTSSPVLKYFRFLKPDYINKTISVKDIQKVCQILPLHIQGDILHDEWKCIQMEVFPEDDDKKKARIDHYWNFIIQLKDSSGSTKYPNVSKLVKAALSLPHGSAEVERGFSLSGRILKEDRASMSLRMLNARLIVAEGLSRYQNKPELVPITKELLALAHSAYAHYKAFMEQEKRLKDERLKLDKEKKDENDRIERDTNEIATKRKKIDAMEESVKMLEKDKEKQTELVDTLFQEANARLKKGIDNKDFIEIRLAQSMLEAAKTKREEEKSKYSEANKVRKNIEKRKSGRKLSTV